MTAGFNPMRWVCKKQGCFNELRRPKIEVFARCFPRRINFGDVDGWVELNGFFCVLEWKGEGGSLKTGQTLTYRCFTRMVGNVVFVVEGDAKTMIVKRYCCFWEGRQRSWFDSDLEGVQRAVESWAKQADAGRFGTEAATMKEAKA